MSSIVLGKSDGKNVSLDLDKLLSTRLLVQANSGKGKSHLLRRIAEQLFGKVQVIIIDPEGEFATLREQYGYVLVGKGGETPADPRSAGLVAHKLLELRASAVCDLYEMKPAARHEWVKKFLEAMVDAPKGLWHPCVVIVDESHVFCPEKGAGESEASEAMIGLATRGRKRGFACIFATQRLGKLRKDAAAELLNIMVGGTFIDVDRKRAADALGVYGADLHKFFDEIKVMERGNFFALGPAISVDRVLVHVGAVDTTHPEAGSAKHGAEPPPAPEAIAKLLPKLSDLPKAAEDKARTEADLRTEIRSLKAQLHAKPKLQPAAADPREIKRIVRQLEDEYGRKLSYAAQVQFTTWQKGRKLIKALDELAKAAIALFPVEEPKIPDVQKQKGNQTERQAIVLDGQPQATPKPFVRPEPLIAGGLTNGGLTPKHIGILKAIAEFEAIGRTQISKSWIAARSGSSYTSSAYTNNLGFLRSNGYIAYPGPDQVALTDKGRGAAGEVDPPETAAELLDSCLRLLSPKQQAILRALYEKYPEDVDKNELADLSGASASSSAYTNNLGSLRSAGMIDYPSPGKVRCADWIFMESAA